MAYNTPNQNNQGQNGGGNDGKGANQGGENNSQGQGGGNGNNQGGQGGGNAGGSNQGGNNGQGQAGGEDYKVKFGESTKENQRLMDIFKKHGIDPKTGEKTQGAGNGGANGQGNQGGNDAGATFFTDEELEATFPSFATMTDQEKQVLRNVGSFPKMARMVAEMHDKLTFGEQLEVLKADPANKIIADNEKEFRAFAYEGNNLKVPLDVLVNAFIGKKTREAGNNGGGNGNQNQGGQHGNQQQRQGMEQGTSGQGASGDAAQEMTAEAARDLRTKDPRKYNALARAGKIKIV